MPNEILNVDVVKELYVEKITPIIGGYVQSGQFTQRDVQIMQYTIEDLCNSLKAAGLYFIQIEIAQPTQQPPQPQIPQPVLKTAPEAQAKNVDLNAEEQKLRAEYFRKLRELEEADVTAQSEPEYVDEEPLPAPPLPPKEFSTQHMDVPPLPPMPPEPQTKPQPSKPSFMEKIKAFKSTKKHEDGE